MHIHNKVIYHHFPNFYTQDIPEISSQLTTQYNWKHLKIIIKTKPDKTHCVIFDNFTN